MLLAIVASVSSYAHAETTSPIQSERLAADAPVPSQLKPKGKRLIATWKFSGADKVPGYLVLSSTTRTTKAGENRQLFAQLYAGAKPAQIRIIQDGVTNCQLDMTSSFVQGAVTFTDIDGDGKVEVAFAYDLGCDATERPTPRKLLVLEGTAKHALRGNGLGKDLDDKPTGGDYKAEGFKGEDALAKWAKARWTELLATPATNIDP